MCYLEHDLDLTLFLKRFLFFKKETWCKGNCEGKFETKLIKKDKYLVMGVSFNFELESDAVAFKIMWAS